jgi:hypothetical protein
MQQTPYPASRRYFWLLAGKRIPINEAERMMKRMRAQANESRNPNRYRAYTLLISALHTLEHRGIDDISAQKLHTLLCTAATEAGWFVDPARYKRKPDIYAPPGYRCCNKCRAVLPESVFGKKQDKLSHLCVDCRYKTADQKRYAVESKEQRAIRDKFEALMWQRTFWLREVTGDYEDFVEIQRKTLRPLRGSAKVKLILGSVLDDKYRRPTGRRAKEALERSADRVDVARRKYVQPYYQLLLTNAKREAYRLRRIYDGDPVRAPFYQYMMDAINKASARLEEMADDNTLGQLASFVQLPDSERRHGLPPSHQLHWTRLLSMGELNELTARHREMSAQCTSNKPLALTTCESLQDMADTLTSRLRRYIDSLPPKHRPNRREA